VEVSTSVMRRQLQKINTPCCDLVYGDNPTAALAGTPTTVLAATPTAALAGTPTTVLAATPTAALVVTSNAFTSCIIQRARSAQKRKTCFLDEVGRRLRQLTPFVRLRRLMPFAPESSFGGSRFARRA